jgi:hypothetical protein
MAYKTIVAKYCANRQAALDEIYTTMSGMGWELVDGNFSPITVAYTAVTIADETFTTTSGSVPANATPVQITSTGTIPGGLAINTLYYVVNRTDTTFKLSTIYNGSAINITTQGTGNHTIKEAFRIYKSNGEDSNRIHEYIQINFNTANMIYFWPHYYWSMSTKSMLGGTYMSTGANLATIETGFYLWIYGNKNLVLVETKVATVYDKMLFGHMNKTMNTLVTTTTSGIATGTGIPISVASTSGFDLTSNYQIIGANGEGRDPLNLNSIDSPTQMTATTIARSYAAGAFIGIQPSVFGGINGGDTSNWYFTCALQVTGTATAASASYATIAPPKDKASTDPDCRTNKYLLQPMWSSTCLENLAANVSSGLAYNDEYLLLCGDIGLTPEDTFSVGRLDAGISSGSNDSTTLNDTSKSWITNAYAGKVIIIIAGIGVGQIKKIKSNSATAVTLSSGWIFEVVPTTSSYVICNEGYRYLASPSTTSMACREGC